jgi:hypothetical protein
VTASIAFPCFLPLQYILPSPLLSGPLSKRASSSDVPCCHVPCCLPLHSCHVSKHRTSHVSAPSFAALAVLLDFLLQVTAFVALVTLDFRRAEGGRVDCLPCLHVAGREEDISGETRPRSWLQAYMEVIPGFSRCCSSKRARIHLKPNSHAQRQCVWRAFGQFPQRTTRSLFIKAYVFIVQPR